MSTTRFGVAAPQPLALPPRPCSTEEPRFMHTSIPHGVAPVGRFAALVDSGEALVSARRVEAAELRAGLSRIDRLLDEPQAHVQPYVPRRPQRPASRPGSRRSSSRSSRWVSVAEPCPKRHSRRCLRKIPLAEQCQALCPLVGLNTRSASVALHL